MEDQNNNDNIIELEKYVTILNIFQTYYRDIHQIKSAESLFDGVDTDQLSSTNRSLELLYQYILEYKQNRAKNIELTSVFQCINVDKYEEIYALAYDGKPVLYSASFLSLISHLANDDWEKINWKITKIKGEL